MEDRPQQLVIVGGGFAGVAAALSAARAREALRATLDICVVNADGWMTLRPRLYERDLRASRVRLREVLDPAGVRLVEAYVDRVEVAAMQAHVRTATGCTVIPFDRLVLAAGSRVRRPVADPHVLVHDVDTFEAASAMQMHVRSVARSSRPADERYRAVLVGAGLAGLETATELDLVLSELAAQDGHPGSAHVTIVDPAPSMAALLGARAEAELAAALARTGVDLVLGRRVVKIGEQGVLLDDNRWIPAPTVVWTAGLEPSPLGRTVSEQIDGSGRIEVDAYLRAPGAQHVFAAGDVAAARLDDDRTTLMSCQYAIPMGHAAGWNAVASLRGAPLRAFEPDPYVTCVDLGAGGGLFTTGWERTPTATGAAGKAIKARINEMIHPAQWGGLDGRAELGVGVTAP